jgi:hypothetical protein
VKVNCRYAKESALLACDAYEGVEQDITLGGNDKSIT